MRILTCLLVLFATAALAASSASPELNRVQRHPHAVATSDAQAFIVKLHTESTSNPQIKAVSNQTAEDRLSSMSQRTGVSLSDHHAITSHMHAIKVLPASTGESTADTLARLRADPDVEYAEIDQRRYIHAVTPSDPLYSQQWYLQIAAATPSATDATDAWSTSTGTNTTVIADIDTGVRYDHPDLAANLLSGYCFISDSFVSNGGTCPGAGASDPGDWITSADLSHSECSGATAGPSSWHGTRVAGILGAIANNNVGVTGMTWSVQLLPVRALGKCGGQDSDILSAMLWAAGISVSGVPDNTHPAKIINMSLGGTGSCPQSYQDAIAQITAKGVLIVASAGNEGGPVDAPANCPGVAAVAGLRQAGTKVGFSSLGKEVTLSAPAGNCVNTDANAPCLYPISTTTNLGATSPDANDYTGQYYCDSITGSSANCTIAANQYRTYNLGTSFSAPIVSGMAALMTAVNSSLNSCGLISRLKQGATAFPQSSSTTTTQCHSPANANDVQSDECICTNDGQTCGAGMADAAAALAAALRPVAAVSVPSTLTAGQTVTLDATGSKAADQSTISSYSWSVVSGQTLSISGAASATATITAPSCRLSTVAVTVTDSAGRTDTADVVITPTSASTTAPSTASGSSSCSTATPSLIVKVCPATQSIQAGSAAQSFTADVANSNNTNVTWQVNGVTGGNATVGTITAEGAYTPPSSVPNPSTVTVTAVSAADSSMSSSSQVTITQPPSGGGALDWLTLAVGTSLFSLRNLRRRR